MSNMCLQKENSTVYMRDIWSLREILTIIICSRLDHGDAFSAAGDSVSETFTYNKS